MFVIPYATGMSGASVYSENGVDWEIDGASPLPGPATCGCQSPDGSEMLFAGMVGELTSISASYVAYSASAGKSWQILSGFGVANVPHSVAYSQGSFFLSVAPVSTLAGGSYGGNIYKYTSGVRQSIFSSHGYLAAHGDALMAVVVQPSSAMSLMYSGDAGNTWSTRAVKPFIYSSATRLGPLQYSGVHNGFLLTTSTAQEVTGSPGVLAYISTVVYDINGDYVEMLGSVTHTGLTKFDMYGVAFVSSPYLGLHALGGLGLYDNTFAISSNGDVRGTAYGYSIDDDYIRRFTLRSDSDIYDWDIVLPTGKDLSRIDVIDSYFCQDGNTIIGGTYTAFSGWGKQVRVSVDFGNTWSYPLRNGVPMQYLYGPVFKMSRYVGDAGWKVGFL